MILPEIEKKIAERMTTVTIMYAAFVGSAVIISGVPFYLSVPGLEDSQPIILALFGVGALNLVLSFVLPRVVGKQIPPGAPPEFETVWKKFFVSTILGVALRESVAIFGLVAYMLSGNLQWPQIFGLAAIAAMVIGWPKAESLRAELSSGAQ